MMIVSRPWVCVGVHGNQWTGVMETFTNTSNRLYVSGSEAVLMRVGAEALKYN